jgi:hypothetical protein
MSSPLLVRMIGSFPKDTRLTILERFFLASAVDIFVVIVLSPVYVLYKWYNRADGMSRRKKTVLGSMF